jgi:hypothetical protein
MSSVSGIQSSQPAQAVNPPAKQSAQPAASEPGTIKDSIQLSPEAQRALAGSGADQDGESH